MDVQIFTVGEVTPLSDTLRPWLAEVSHAFSGSDYGGPMENLWIEVEVHEYGMNIPGRPPWPFRFQKRVSPPRLVAGLGPVEPKPNVGHYSVRPTADDMRADSSVVAARQVLGVVLASTACLADKRQLRGFDVTRFRNDLAQAFERFGSSVPGAHRAGG
jgi:hypothetical protein